MTTLELIRLETSPSGTIGILRADKRLLCYTLEPPKHDNERNISCIPTGSYMAKHYVSTRYKRVCIRLYNVPNRDNIVIHPGNTIKSTRGCILVGTSLGSVGGRRAVTSSQKAMDYVISETGQICSLTISELF